MKDVVHRAAELGGQDAQGLALATFLLLPLQPLLGALAAAQKQARRLGEGPAQVRVADLPLPVSPIAEARRLVHRLQGWFMAPRPVAQGSRQQNFCCVTTRCRNLGVLRCLRQRGGTLTARPLRRGVLDFGRIVLASSRLPPRRLPAADQPPAFGVLAVTLVPTPRLVLVPTALAQTDPRPRSSRTGTAAALWINMTAAHGSVDLPRDSPGGTRYRSPRALRAFGKKGVRPPEAKGSDPSSFRMLKKLPGTVDNPPPPN